MKICVVQTKSIKGNIQSNIEIHKRWIDIGISQKSDLIIFPELSLTGYEPALAEGLATGHNDTRLDDFQNISNRYNVAIGVGLPTKSNFGVFISMIIFQPNRPRQTYSKIASKYSISVLMSNCIGFCDDFESAGQTSIWDDNGILKGQLDNLNEGLLVYDTELKTMS